AAIRQARRGRGGDGAAVQPLGVRRRMAQGAGDPDAGPGRGEPVPRPQRRPAIPDRHVRVRRGATCATDAGSGCGPMRPLEAAMTAHRFGSTGIALLLAATLVLGAASAAEVPKNGNVVIGPEYTVDPAV